MLLVPENFYMNFFRIITLAIDKVSYISEDGGNLIIFLAEKYITIEYVQFVENLIHNILSVSRLAREHLTQIHFVNNSCFQHCREAQIEVVQENDLFKISTFAVVTG